MFQLCFFILATAAGATSSSMFDIHPVMRMLADTGESGECPASIPEPLDPVLERVLDAGASVWGDSEVADSNDTFVPPWFDEAKFRRGQKFAQKYLLGVLISELHSLFLLYTFPNLLDPMVFTGKSDTPDKAYIRYADTVDRVMSWYYYDVFDPQSKARANLQEVRSLHAEVRGTMNSLDEGQLRNRTQVPRYMKCPLVKGMRADFEHLCPYGRKVDFDNYGRLWMSQRDMSVTQWGFLGLVIQFPEAYGIPEGAESEEDMDGFVFLWRVLGYLLGVEDQYNFCQGGLEATRRRSQQLVKYFVLPNMREVTPKWEHMSRCMADGIGYFVVGNDFETGMTVLLNDSLRQPSSTVEHALNWNQRVAIEQYRATVRSLRVIPNAWQSYSFVVRGVYLALTTLVSRESIIAIRHKPDAQKEDCYANQ